MGHVERVQARGEAAMSELHGRLMAARVEVEASSARAEELSRQVAASSADASSRQRELEEAYHKAFHNHCLLAKLLLNTRKRVCAWHEGRHSRPLSTNSRRHPPHTRNPHPPAPSPAVGMATAVGWLWPPPPLTANYLCGRNPRLTATTSSDTWHGWWRVCGQPANVIVSELYDEIRIKEVSAPPPPHFP